jgi:hypothetical protein
MAIGIGGAGGKLASLMSPNSVAVNVSETELSKTNAAQKILAFAHTERGQLKGSKKDPSIGKTSFNSIRAQILELIQGSMVISSSGGGTGNGITSQILDVLATYDTIPDIRKTELALILPYAPRESHEFIVNTLEFLKGPLSNALDSTNTGNLFLFSNKMKFEQRISEDKYNQMIVESLKKFETIPLKGDQYELLEGHIDLEDFSAYRAKSFFNYFCYFDYDPERYFGDQLNENANPLLLSPDTPIEALFLLEVPPNMDHTIFYNILDHFASIKVAPMYSVICNPNIDKPFVTVSILYSRKPMELVNDFNRISEESTKAKIDKSLEQYVHFETMEVSLQEKVNEVANEKGGDQDEILSVLKRLGKLK